MRNWGMDDGVPDFFKVLMDGAHFRTAGHLEGTPSGLWGFSG